MGWDIPQDPLPQLQVNTWLSAINSKTEEAFSDER